MRAEGPAPGTPGGVPLGRRVMPWALPTQKRGREEVEGMRAARCTWSSPSLGRIWWRGGVEEEAGWEAGTEGGRRPGPSGPTGPQIPVSYGVWSICGGEGILVAAPLLIRGGRGFLLRLRETRTKR